MDSVLIFVMCFVLVPALTLLLYFGGRFDVEKHEDPFVGVLTAVVVGLFIGAMLLVLSLSSIQGYEYKKLLQLVPRDAAVSYLKFVETPSPTPTKIPKHPFVEHVEGK